MAMDWSWMPVREQKGPGGTEASDPSLEHVATKVERVFSRATPALLCRLEKIASRPAKHAMSCRDIHLACRLPMIDPDPTDIATRFASVQADVARTCRDMGRSPADVTLIAVSKTHPAPMIRPVLEAGHRVFGENYVQETAAKWPALRVAFPDVQLHLIGPLQSNKAKEAVALFDVIQTLDRESLARELSKEMKRQGRSPRLYLQVNTGREPQKGGIDPSGAESFVAMVRERYDLEITGLMCIPPAQDPPSPHFAWLNQMARKLGLARLSMGMSADYPAAIQLGATEVRIGSAIFGARG
jgi:pyridoxal phosphate enzyme (YggS family)